MQDLPEYVFLDIVCTLRPKDIVNLAMSCRLFAGIISRNMPLLLSRFAGLFGLWYRRPMLIAVRGGYMPWIRVSSSMMLSRFFKPNGDSVRVFTRDDFWEGDFWWYSLHEASFTALSRPHVLGMLLSPIDRFVKEHAAEADLGDTLQSDTWDVLLAPPYTETHSELDPAAWRYQRLRTMALFRRCYYDMVGPLSLFESMLRCACRDVYDPTAMDYVLDGQRPDPYQLSTLIHTSSYTPPYLDRVELLLFKAIKYILKELPEADKPDTKMIRWYKSRVNNPPTQ